ncbi:MAG TPA: hypothetical protein VJS30_31050 [Paraburkholderia sp.]|nr:hypothetical protein [Paraburkholderia sp.]
MNKTLGWLHLSDLHFWGKRDWKNSPVLEKLLKDIAALRRSGLQSIWFFARAISVLERRIPSH